MKNKVCKISLFSAILASVSTLPVDAAIRTNNSSRSYANAYNQVNAMRYQQEYLDATATNATTASATATLPVMVSDEKLASAILNNTADTTVGQLESCAMIYPNGVFKWAIPESGIRRNQLNQCVAEVSLVDANTNTILATTTLAAGDSMKCNIDSFPESGMNAAALSKAMLPADAAPTMDDVVVVMNEEQKQNAGFKIAAGAIISAVAGNALSKKEAGNSGILGTSKNQLTGTAIGAVTGAGIMAASSYTGKVAGDTIKSTAVNAASGMIVGNMMAGASGEGGILVVKTCNIDTEIKATSTEKEGATQEAKAKQKDSSYPKISKGDHDCIAGKIEIRGASLEEGKVYLVNKTGNDFKKCTEANGILTCEKSLKLLDIQLDGINKPLKDMKSGDWGSTVAYTNEEGDPAIFTHFTDAYEKDNAYFKVKSASIIDSSATKHAYIVFQNSISFESHKLGGHKTSELDAVKGKQDYIYVYRNSDGSVGSQITTPKSDVVFTPTSGDASDGGLVDLSNQARTKGTIAGAAAGGALGGFAGYQGAQTEITDRWTAAVREYEDSLSNFVCMTGKRYLSKYNDYIEIPTPKESQ